MNTLCHKLTNYSNFYIFSQNTVKCRRLTAERSPNSHTENVALDGVKISHF